MKTEDLSERTLALFGPQSARPLAPEDAREMVENVVGFFRLLQQWERAQPPRTDGGESKGGENGG